MTGDLQIEHIWPQPGPQTEFLSTPATVAIYGGQAGGGKTWDIVVEPTRFRHIKGFNSITFRTTYSQIFMADGLWDLSMRYYPRLASQPGKPKESKIYFEFPAGARIGYSYLQGDFDLYKWDGLQAAMLGFDQLEHFTEKMWWYLSARNRTTCGIRAYTRATCNPDPDSWLAKFIEWWIDQDTGYPIEDRSGVIRWFARVDEEVIWRDTPQEFDEFKVAGPRGEIVPIQPQSCTFIPASVYDNKILLKEQPEYLSKLLALPLVDRERLLKGNWKIREDSGNVFNRAWFHPVSAAPAGGITCRFFDLAATEKDLAHDYTGRTASTLMRVVDGRFTILDCTEELLSPVETDHFMINTARQDKELCEREGSNYWFRWEQEGGSAGKRDAVRISQMMAGIDCAARRPSGDKLVRAKPFAAQAEAGNVDILVGAWNERYLNHLHNQPNIKLKDIMDSSSGAFNELTAGGWSRGVR